METLASEGGGASVYSSAVDLFPVPRIPELGPGIPCECWHVETLCSVLRKASGRVGQRRHNIQNPLSTTSQNRKKKIFDEKTIESKAIAQEEAITRVSKQWFLEGGRP